MGMDYYIMPKEELSCENDFPEMLSQFFEQVGGYREFAEVSQVSKLFSIDLSIFQDIEYDVNNEEEDELHWHSVKEYLSTIDSLVDKIQINPNYHEQVHHEARKDNSGFVSELQKVASLQDEQEQEKQWSMLKNKYERRYPPDYGYLSSGQILEDLKILRQTLECYIDNGVTEARLFYM